MGGIVRARPRALRRAFRCPRTLPSTALPTIAMRIASHQPTAPMIASTIITGQTTPATVPIMVSATDGGGTLVLGMMTEPDANGFGSGEDFASFPSEPASDPGENEGCCHCGSGSAVGGWLVTCSW